MPTSWAWLKAHWFALLVVLALVVGIGHVGSCYAERHAKAVSAVALANAETSAALKRVAADSDALAAQSARGDSLALLAATEGSRADSALHVADVAVAKYRALAAHAPAVCATTDAAADTAIDADSSSIATLQGALTASRQTSALYRSALDSTRADLDALVKGAQPLTVSAAEAVKKPTPLARLVPHKYFGVMAGIDQAGRPALVAGAGLGWSF